MSGSNTGATVLDGSVGNGELAEVVTDHLSLDFNVGEGLSVVNSNDGTDHLGDDDDVTEVSLDGLGALSEVRVNSNLGITQLAHEVGLSLLESTGELSADTSGEEIEQLIGRHRHEVLEIYSTVRELAEHSLAGSVILRLVGHPVC